MSSSLRHSCRKSWPFQVLAQEHEVLTSEEWAEVRVGQQEVAPGGWVQRYEEMPSDTALRTTPSPPDLSPHRGLLRIP